MPGPFSTSKTSKVAKYWAGNMEPFEKLRPCVFRIVIRENIPTFDVTTSPVFVRRSNYKASILLQDEVILRAGTLAVIRRVPPMPGAKRKKTSVPLFEAEYTMA